MEKNQTSNVKQRILVTGGSRGIGKAIVEEFLQEGNDVVFTCRTQSEDLSQWCQIQRDLGKSVRCLEFDLLNVDSINLKLKEEINTYGEFSVVVHNAAICSDVPFLMMEDKQWWDVIQTTLNSLYYVNKLVLPSMVRKRSGRIIGIASISGEAGNRGQMNYAAAKGALISGMKSLAKEVASRGICVNIVSPGLIDTSMTANLPYLENIKQMIPVGRVGRPDEIAKVVKFLASPDASYIVGEVIRVNGGFYT